MEKICLLGASGSIGIQTLDVIKKNPNDFLLVSFSVGKQINKISNILKKFKSVKSICVQNEIDAIKISKKYPHLKVYFGDDGLLKLIDSEKHTLVVNALVGFVGLKPTIYSLENHIDVALANKESLVVGGELINNLLSKGYSKLYPIDSEHNALWKCLKVDDQNVKKMYLTASGGAFRNLNRNELINVTAADALNHPTWKMGAKITIDCATMVNKAFEIIEAHYLYQYPYEKIGITLHDESHVHSYLQYNDGTLRADISKPDMRNPIKFALYRGEIPFETFQLSSLNQLSNYHFHDFVLERYPVISFAKIVIEKKGGYGAIFNASNEEAVRAFLNNEIKFLDIENIIKECMTNIPNQKCENYEKLLQFDTISRKMAQKLIYERRIK